MLDRVPNVIAAGRLLAGGRSRTKGGVVLGYHDVTDGPARTDYDVTVAALRQQLVALQAWGLRIVPLADLADALIAGQTVDGMVAVTFDDALEGVYRHAWPLLRELEVPFTVFAVSAELGGDPAWWPDAGRIMSQPHLVEMADAGVAIESHSRHHPSLPAVSATVLRDEVVGGKAEIENITGRETTLLAYPFGHHDPAVREVSTEAGFRAGFSFLNGRVTNDQDIFRLPRFTMTSAHHRARLALHVSRRAESWPDTQCDAVKGEG
ncbi:MAG: polysaccharide deacetylase family protein [Acidimicrobiales bacterium]